MKNNDDDGKEINIHEHQLCAHHCFSLFLGGGVGAGMNVNLLKLVLGRMGEWTVMGFPKRTVGSSQRPAKRERVLSHRPYLSPNFSSCFLHSRPRFRAFHVLLRSLVGHEPTYLAFISTHGAHIVAGVLKAEEARAHDLASALVTDPLSLKEAWEGEGAKGESQDGISISLPRSPQKIRTPSASHSSRLGSSQLLPAAPSCRCECCVNFSGFPFFLSSPRDSGI